MTNPNRIDNVTAANEAENKRLAPIHKEDIVTVSPFLKVGIVALVGGLTSSLPFITGVPLIVVTVALGIVTSVGLLFGMNVGTTKK